LLVFIFDFTSFGVILILGGARLATIVRQCEHDGHPPIEGAAQREDAVGIRLVLNVGALDFGRVVASGDPNTVLRDPAVARSFLGAEGP
jgi:hypothetical protein